MRQNLAQWCSRIWRSSMLIGLVATIVRVGAQLLLLPTIMVCLSVDQLAMWWIFVALGNFANLADFGFGPAISRVYQFLWAGADDFEIEGLRATEKINEPNLPLIRILNCTVRHFYFRLSMIVILILGIGGTLYLSKAITDSPHPERMWLLWGSYLLAIGFNFQAGHWLLACQGINRVRELQFASLFSGVAYVMVALFLLKLGYGLNAMVAATFARALVLWYFGKATFCKAVAPFAPYTKPDFGMLRRLWPNAKKFGVLSIGAYLLANGNVLLSRYFLGVPITAAVGLTNQIGTFLMNFASLWLGVKWPEITILRTQGKIREMSALFARRLGFVVLTYVVSALLVIFLGNFLLNLKGSSTRLLPRPYLILYFGYIGIQMFYVQFGALTFTENVMPFFKIGLFTGIGVILCSLVLTPAFGLWGLLLAPFIVESLYSSWYTVRRGFQGQGLSVREFLHVSFYGKL